MPDINPEQHVDPARGEQFSVSTAEDRTESDDATAIEMFSPPEHPLRDLLIGDEYVDDLLAEMRRELQVELARYSPELLPANAPLVHALYKHLCGPGLLTSDELLRFLRAAARVLCEEICSRPHVHGTVANDGGETTPAGEPAGQAAILQAVQSSPYEFAANEERRRVLETSEDPEDRSLADLYLLAVYAGRTPEELAEILGRPLIEIRTRLALASVGICGTPA